jgi:hypothetical protein
MITMSNFVITSSDLAVALSLAPVHLGDLTMITISNFMIASSDLAVALGLDIDEKACRA